MKCWVAWVVKYLAWGALLEESYGTARQQIPSVVEAGFYHRSWQRHLGAPIFQPVLIFWYYTRKLGRSLDASTAFSTLALFAC